jgi:flagellar biosynthesis/type III secretory pathway protein FliH
MSADDDRVLVALFELIESVLQGECGDGDVHIHCKYRDREEVARHFGAWHSSLPTARLVRVPDDAGIDSRVVLFSDMSNENVSFSSAQDEIDIPDYYSLVATL